MDRVATGRAGSVFAIEIAKQRAIIEAENRMRGDFVDDLLAGSFTTEEAAISRAKLLGYDLRPPYAILVYGWDQPMVDLQSQYGDGYVQRLRIALDLALGDGLSAEGRKALLRVRNDQAYVAYPAAQMDTTEVERVAERLRQRVLARSDSAPISVGVSPTFSLLGAAPTAFHQAEQALTIAQRLFGGNRAIHFDRLGVYRLLFPLRDRPELQQFYDEMLRALNEYDQRHGSNLVGTLREYFIHHGNLSKVSEALFVHRNTLSYRLERIQLISGRNLEDAEDRLSLHLALKLEDML
jgi:purine catabolism regulator